MIGVYLLSTPRYYPLYLAAMFDAMMPYRMGVESSSRVCETKLMVILWDRYSIP